MKEAMNEEYRLPDGLDKAAEDAILAAVLAEKGPDCLVPEPRRRSPRRWIWGAVPAVALAALGCVLYFGQSQPRFDDPAAEAVYAQVEQAFNSFCEAAQAGYNAFSDKPISQ